ncbi:hypothetical protein D3C76_1418590 [compost metagenome]
MNQLVVGQAVQASCSIDTHDPQLAEVALGLAAVTVCVDQGFVDLLFGGLENAVLGTEVTLCQFQNFFMFATYDDAAFNSCHLNKPPK